MFKDGMWIFYLESALALGMFVFIVWWTLPKKAKAPDKNETNTLNSSRNESVARTAHSSVNNLSQDSAVSVGGTDGTDGDSDKELPRN